MTLKNMHIYIVGIPEGKEKSKDRTGVLVEIIVRNFQNLMKFLSPQIQEYQKPQAT